MSTKQPPDVPSEEADRMQLELAKEEGRAYSKSLEYMANKVAENGGSADCGDMVVAFAQEKAEGLYRLRDGELVWEEPSLDQNCHLEISVLDANDRRFIPCLDVRLTVTDAKGNQIGSEMMPFLWHPGMYHYGKNWALPGNGAYDLEVEIKAPDFPRHDKENGQRYSRPVRAHFRSVEITTGRS